MFFYTVSLANTQGFHLFSRFEPDSDVFVFLSVRWVSHSRYFSSFATGLVKASLRGANNSSLKDSQRIFCLMIMNSFLDWKLYDPHPVSYLSIALYPFHLVFFATDPQENPPGAAVIQARNSPWNHFSFKPTSWIIYLNCFSWSHSRKFPCFIFNTNPVLLNAIPFD